MRHRYLERTARWPRIVTVAALAAATSGVIAAGPAAAQTYTPLPAHVYAPYYETYLAPNTASIAATAQASGSKPESTDELR